MKVSVFLSEEPRAYLAPYMEDDELIPTFCGAFSFGKGKLQALVELEKAFERDKEALLNLTSKDIK